MAAALIFVGLIGLLAELSLGPGLNNLAVSHLERAVTLGPITAGIFFLVHQTSGGHLQRWAEIGRYSLGVYLLHPALLLVLSKLNPRSSIIGPPSLVLSTYAATLGCVWLLARHRVVRQFVR